MKSKMSQYCYRIGLDRLLVQGAGGNVSWKSGSTMWVKASGKWLSDALNENIFVKVDLNRIRSYVRERNFDIKIESIDKTNLRPSIETTLHGLMPQKIVVHVHSVQLLSLLVSPNFIEEISPYLNHKWIPAFVPYITPGSDLANAVSNSLVENELTNLVLLQNHGVVVGGDSIEEVDTLLSGLIDAISENINKPKLDPLAVPSHLTPALLSAVQNLGYKKLVQKEFDRLCSDAYLYKCLDSHWCYAPDHVVFLGGESFRFQSIEEFVESNVRPPLVFIAKIGVLVDSSWTRARHDQLLCFYDVLCSRDLSSGISVLSSDEVDQLINWESEKFRVQSSK
jgi:rhamnose utilization protein RhaD (predicted bifunctional aldolase and dehydrogenase)